MVKEIKNVAEFDSEISKERVLVDMFAVWCGPCQMLSPIVDEFAEENKDINVIKVNVDEVPEIAERYHVMSIPTLLYIEKSNLINSSLGYVSKDSIQNLCKK